MRTPAQYHPRRPGVSLKIPVSFLFHSSSMTVSEYELSRLNLGANLKKQVRVMLDQIVDNMVEAQFARWMTDNREELRSTIDALHLGEKVFNARGDSNGESAAKFRAADCFIADASAD